MMLIMVVIGLVETAGKGLCGPNLRCFKWKTVGLLQQSLGHFHDEEIYRGQKHERIEFQNLFLENLNWDKSTYCLESNH